MPRVELAAAFARDARPGLRDTVLFDRTLPGFGLRVHPSGRKVWILEARINGRTRRLWPTPTSLRPPSASAP